MLTHAQTALITATVPLLEAHGETLTRHFYQTLFKDFPQVIPLFNQSNQAGGTQQRALASAVLCYARHIESLDQLGPLVATIVNKHVSLQILPEHYPYVGASLLKAIREVLGAEVATDAVIDAWAAAYGQLASLLIDAERSKYAEQAAAPGGWNGVRAFRLVRKTAESAEITSFVLRPADDGPVMDFEPGQYIGVRVDIDGQEHKRQYSLSAVSNLETYQISVKREAGGKVSNHLHDTLQLGDSIDLFAPAGAFTLQPGERPLVLISGGVGITPTLAMLTSALRSKRRVHFIHAARNGAVHAFREQIDTLARQFPQLRQHYCYAEHDGHGPAPHAVGLLDQALLAQWLPGADVDAYFLGPTGFMRSVKASLQALGVPAAQARYEFFGPAEALQ
ncbi:MAG: NO-inducible flavohemoprotein [Duganella sp.]